MVFIISKFKKAKVIFTVIGVLVVIFFFVYVVQSTKKNDLDSIAVNENNGDIAIAYYTTAAKIEVFDSNGNEKFSKVLYDKGTGIYKMVWDNDKLCIWLGRTKKGVVFDSNGNQLDSVYTGEFPELWNDDWKKHGSSYQKQVGENTYCYDYAAWYQYFGKPIDTIYIKNSQNEKCIWQDRE